MRSLRVTGHPASVAMCQTFLAVRYAACGSGRADSPPLVWQNAAIQS